MPKGRLGCLGCSFPFWLLIAIIVLFIVGFLAGPIGQGIAPGVNLPDWIKVPQPQPELPAEVTFHIGPFPITNAVATGWITIVVLVVLARIATRRMKLVPGRFQAAVEFLFSYIYNFCKEVAGETWGRRFFPFIATIFIFVVTNAWLNLIPGWGTITVTEESGKVVPLLRGANTDVNFPLALALVSFILVGYYGMKAHGFRFLGQFFAFGKLSRSLGQIFRGNLKGGMGGLFFGVIDLFVGALELLSQFIRILSFTFRLFGNMTAGEILILMIMFLVPWVATIPFYGLELLVGYIQALIFAGLTLVFLTSAVAHHETE